MMDRSQAYQLMTEMVQNPNLRKHGLAVEAIMGALCSRLRQMHPQLPPSEFDEEEWKIVGLLHDADYEVTNKDLKRHVLVTSEKLESLGVSKRIIDGIKAHSDTHKPSRENFLEKSIYAADELSGLIIATALVRPDKKLASLTVESVLKKFPQKQFAAGANRDQILTCEKELGLPLSEFVKISLEAIQKISADLGL